jgi:hypothetical protein
MRIYVDGKKIGASPYNAKELNDSKASLYIGVGDSAQWANVYQNTSGVSCG